jgi:hypothetical protein
MGLSCYSDSVLYANRIEAGPTSMVPYRIRLPRSKRHALQDYRIKSADEDVNMQSQDAKGGELNGGMALRQSVLQVEGEGIMRVTE